ncbi:MAG TPA: hypothetical protein VNO22_08960 [Planctomycetota bacterium]|nr:hypothetical protein [Planctomycetota bacterium]
MADLKEILASPFRWAGALVRILGRVTIGAAGFVLMGAGLLLMEPFHLLWLGLPVFLVGLLLLVKAIF